ncbi:MAG: hypothetical protein K0S51_2146 [Bacillales bacterium]|jgi:hypothetical protein|nr:hypothetical protein [Bacillales bacterium]
MYFRQERTESIVLGMVLNKIRTENLKSCTDLDKMRTKKFVVTKLCVHAFKFFRQGGAKSLFLGALLHKGGAINQIDGAIFLNSGAKRRKYISNFFESYNFMTLSKYVLKTKHLYYN